MNVVVYAAARLTIADAAVIELHEGDDMVYRAGAGKAKEFLGLRLKASKSLSGLCVERDETLRCDDSELDERVDREACRRVGARSMLVTPLRHRSIPLGVLKVYSAQPSTFDETSAEVLRLLVGIVSASMKKARDHEGLTERALRDALTGLANRTQLDVAMRERMDAMKPFALLFLDLNGFKQINDDQGHVAGDVVLRAVAERITSCLRVRDVAVRFGGDEFVVLIDGIESQTAAGNTLQRLVACITAPMETELGTFQVGASGGTVMFPRDGTTADALIRLADARMYEDKNSRKS